MVCLMTEIALTLWSRGTLLRHRFRYRESALVGVDRLERGQDSLLRSIADHGRQRVVADHGESVVNRKNQSHSVHRISFGVGDARILQDIIGIVKRLS